MIQDGKRVKIHYTLTVNGEIADSSRDREPLEYKHGSGEIIMGLEKALEGLKPGDQKEVLVAPDDGYGPINLQAIVEISREHIQSRDVQLGAVLSGKTQDGRPLRGVITAIGDDQVTVDFNHPLAGKELHFQIEIIEVTD